MVDSRAFDLFQKKDIVGLFRYLGPMWIKVSMEILEDLLTKGFYPNPNRYQAELAAAGIDVARMEVAMAAALSKGSKQTTWGEFESANDSRLKRLPKQQQDEIRQFWFEGASPGLPSAGPSAFPVFFAGKLINTSPAQEFTAGFVEGLAARMDPANFGIVKSKILANPVDFYVHYVGGVFVGLYEGAKGLIEALIALFKLSINLSPPGIVYNAIRAAVDSKFRAETVKTARDAKDMAEAVLALMVEFAKNPDLYIAQSRGAGKTLGEAFAGEINEGVVVKSAQQIGDFVGEIIGRVLFEVILMIATEGVGSAVRGSAAAGEAGGTVARIAARVADKLRDGLEGLPALRRVFVKFLGESEAGLRLARWGRRGAELRLAEGSGSRAAGKLWKEGVAEAEEYMGRSGVRKSVDAPRTELTQPPRHVMKPGPIPEGELNKGIPDHLKNLSPEEKRKWIDSAEGKKWRDTQRLDGPANTIENTPPHAGPRDHDAEANMFEELLRKTTRDATGEFHFKVDRPVCPACKDMIFRFAKDRPGIRVVQHSLDNAIVTP